MSKDNFADMAFIIMENDMFEIVGWILVIAVIAVIAWSSFLALTGISLFPSMDVQGLAQHDMRSISDFFVKYFDKSFVIYMMALKYALPILIPIFLFIDPKISIGMGFLLLAVIIDKL